MICLGLAIQSITETVVVEKHVEVSVQPKESGYVVASTKITFSGGSSNVFNSALDAALDS